MRTVQVSLDFVNNRCFAYGKKLEKWKEYDNQSSVLNLDRQATEQMVGCFRDLQGLITGYNRLREMVTAGETPGSMGSMSVEEIQNLQENDVLFLEGFCGRLLDDEQRVTGFGQAEEGRSLEQLEQQIAQAFQNREHEQVVQLWLEIPEEKQGQITISTKLIYGKSLMFLHQEQKAASMYERIITELNQKDQETTDVLVLYKMLSKLYMAGRNYSAAAVQYQKIVRKVQDVLVVREWSELQQSLLKRSKMGGRELNDYSALLRSYLGYIPSKDGYQPVWKAEQFLQKYPASPMMTNVESMKAEMRVNAGLWFKRLMADVQELQEQGKYQDGLLLLETTPQDIVDQTQAQLMQQKIEELRGANEVVQETIKAEKIQALEGRWNQMLTLVEGGRYDEAIDQLNVMLETDYAAKAAAKIVEVSLIAAKAKRQQAARLFIRATRTEDMEERKQLLVESHQLLLEIVLKYADTPIVDKVMANIKRVELEMDKLDPALVEWSKNDVQQRVLLGNQQTQIQKGY